MPSRTLISPVITGFLETGRHDDNLFSREKTFYPEQRRPDDVFYDAFDDDSSASVSAQYDEPEYDVYPGICACGYSYRAYGLKFCSLDCHLEYDGSTTVLPTKVCTEQPTVFKVATLKQIAFKALTAKLNREYSTARYPEFKTVASYAASRLTEIYAVPDDPEIRPEDEYAAIKADCAAIAEIGLALAENAKRDLSEIAVVRADVGSRRSELLQEFCDDLIEIRDLDAALPEEDRAHFSECGEDGLVLYPETRKVIEIIIDAIAAYDATKALRYFQDYVLDRDYLHDENFYHENERRAREEALLGYCASVSAYVFDVQSMACKTDSAHDTAGVTSMIRVLTDTSIEPAPDLCKILHTMLAYELIQFYISSSATFAWTDHSRKIDFLCDLLSYDDALYDCEWGIMPGPNLYTEWDHQYRNAGTRIKIPMHLPYDNRTLTRKLTASGYVSRYRDTTRRAFLT